MHPAVNIIAKGKTSKDSIESTSIKPSLQQERIMIPMAMKKISDLIKRTKIIQIINLKIHKICRKRFIKPKQIIKAIKIKADHQATLPKPCLRSIVELVLIIDQIP